MLGHLLRHDLGTTSACAENTAPALLSVENIRNYLRVRGEYIVGNSRERSLMELPPRARRILHQINPYTGETGTTSACAENTYDAALAPGNQGNYLRVRGEYDPNALPGWLRGELPPRARRIP